MAKEICISSTPHETRLAILEDDQLTEIYYERENEYTLAGSIYKGRVTRVLPGMQSAFVDVGLERDAFLYVTDFLEEAGDSADFERMGTQPNRAESKPREPREPRQRPPQKVDYSSESNQHAPDQRAIELTVSPPPPPEEGREEEADGSGTRRWRGRRGRRRSGSRSGAPTSASKSTSDPGQTDASFQASGLPFESVASIDMLPYDDTEPFSSTSSVPSMDASSAPDPQSRPFEREPRSREPRRERSRESSHDSVPTVSLPGESLSKYGAKPAESAAVPAGTAPVVSVANANVSGFKPKTLIETPVLLDGGSLLAGESISRHRRSTANTAVTPAPVVQEAVSPTAHEEAISLATETHIQEIAILDDHQGSTQLADEHASEHHPEPVQFAHQPVAPAAITDEPTGSEVHQIHGVASHESPHTEAASETEAQETEPQDASAYHKVDPSAPSEFRLPWFADKSKTKEAAEVRQPVTTPVVSESSAQEGGTPIQVSAHTPDHSPDQPREAASSANEGEAPHHQAGAAQPGGVDTISGFAPGAGVLEEEIIEEEEYDFTPLHAQSDEHEHDELEEETIDQQLGGAELGEMVREAALDQRINIPYGSGVSSDEEAEDDAEESAADLAEAEAYGDEISEDASVADGAPAPSRRVDENRRGGRGRQGRRGRSGPTSGGGGRGGRQNTQPSDLPIISDLLKQGQEILVQIAKEPIAKKGARITSHIALPGRFLVFMPTVNHVGVSRKISSDEERQRLKRILISEKGDAVGGFIVRTAAATASEEDLRADIRFLLSLWTGIKERSDTAKAPALIYHDLNLVERVLRDQVSDNFSSIWVDNEVEYERIVRFLQRFQPSLVRRVKLYTKETPLFEQFGIQDEITKALKSKVWLKSGGSIVINQTEALVAIDINTGKYVGKTSRLEDTILRTNLDAIPEIVRQIRLRDLGGIIVIDFIDMDERKNRHRVMLALEEALKSDRAPSKVLQFNDFGLVAITRKRVKQSLERTLSVQCEVCTGTGMVKSPITVCNEIYTEMRKMHRTFETPDVLLRVNPEVVKTLKSSGAKWLTEMEEMISKNIIVKSDASLHPEQFDIH